MEENNKHVQPNSKEEGVQRLNRILSESLIKATDTYKTPPQIIWVDNSSIATLGNFSASTGKAKAKRPSTCLPWWLHHSPTVRFLTIEPVCQRESARYCM